MLMIWEWGVQGEDWAVMVRYVSPCSEYSFKRIKYITAVNQAKILKR